jgi:hypothetical protein
MKLAFALILLLLISVTKAEVSLSNLQQFWEATYDPNRDGIATMQEFTEYFKLM